MFPVPLTIKFFYNFSSCKNGIFSQAYQRPEVRVVRIDAPIYFANAAYIKTRLYNLAGLNDAIHQLKKSKDDTVEDEAKNYAYTNTLAMDDNRDPTVERYARKFSTVPEKGPALANGNADVLRQKTTKDLEDGLRNAGITVDFPASVTPTLHVIIDCSEVSFVDVTGVSFLKKTVEECNSIGVVLLLACTKSKLEYFTNHHIKKNSPLCVPCVP